MQYGALLHCIKECTLQLKPTTFSTVTCSDDKLRQILLKLDGRSYKTYQDIKGQFRFPDFSLFIDHVQSDPFANPSRFRIEMHPNIAQFPEELHCNPIRQIALADDLCRGCHSIQKRIRV